MDIAEKEMFKTGQKSPYKAPPPYILQLRQLSLYIIF